MAQLNNNNNNNKIKLKNFEKLCLSSAVSQH